MICVPTLMRRLLAAAVLVSAAVPATGEILSARYVSPTDSYGHGAVPGGEYLGLSVRLSPDREIAVTVPAGAGVYEDTAPRLADLDGDGSPELVTVFSDADRGAAIRIWDEVPDPDGPRPTALARVAETAPIGQRHRWLAIAGIGDIDGDGRVEIAYVDRPHLARVLRLVAVEPGADGWRLVPVAEAPGLTNHHFASPMIEGGLRSCPGALPVIVTADAGWARVMETSWQDGALTSTPVGPYTGPESLAARLACD